MNFKCKHRTYKIYRTHGRKSRGTIFCTDECGKLLRKKIMRVRDKKGFNNKVVLELK